MFLKAVSLLSQINLFQVRHLKEVHRIKRRNKELFYDYPNHSQSKMLELSDFNLTKICVFAISKFVDFKEYEITLEILATTNSILIDYLLLISRPIDRIYSLIINTCEFDYIEYEKYLKNKFNYIHKICFNISFGKLPYNFLNERKTLHILIVGLTQCVIEKLPLHIKSFVKDIIPDIKEHNLKIIKCHKCLLENYNKIKSVKTKVENIVQTKYMHDIYIL